MSQNAIAFLAGLGSGYLNANERKDKQKRDDEDRALRNEASRLQIDAAKKQVTDQQAIAAAGAPVTMTEGAGGMLKPETMDNRDVGLDENAALPDQGLQTGAFAVGGKSFAERGLAETALAAENAPAARQKRVIAAMSGIDPVKALDLEHTQEQRGRETVKFTQEQEAYAKRLKEEGVIDATKALRKGDGAGMVAAFNKGGEFQIEGEPVVKEEPRDIPGFGSIKSYTATFQIKGKDGVLKPMTINSHDLGMSNMPYEKYLSTLRDGTKEAREGRESDSKVGLQNAQAGYYGAAAGAKEATAAKPLVERMSEYDKSTLSSINKQRDTINTAITKAQAEGSWDDTAAGSKSLKTKLAALSMQEAKLNEKYGEGVAGQPDPLGMRTTPAAAGGSSTRIAPATQAARDSDALSILQSELAAAQKRLEGGDPRAQGDIEGLQREIGRASKKVGAPVMAAAGLPAPVAKAAPVAAPAAAAPAAPVAAPPAVAAPAPVKPSMASAMGVGTSGSAIDQVLSQKVPQVEAAAAGLVQAKAQLAAVAKSGDPVALQAYAAKVQEAKKAIDAFLKDMAPVQAEAVRQAAGYYS